MTTNIELDSMRADQLAANCPCGETNILTLDETSTVNGRVAAVYAGSCRTCGRDVELRVGARRRKTVAPLERRDPVPLPEPIGGGS